MKATLALVTLANVAHTAEVKVTPVQKVIELLQGMLDKGKKEKHEESVQFAAEKQFCDDTAVEKQNAIKEADDLIATLKADIQKYVADAEQLTLEIQEHEEDIATWTGDLKAAAKVRKAEKADYDATHKDYSESVSALERAIAVIKKQTGDVPQLTQLSVHKATSLTQLSTMEALPQDAKQAIQAFLQDNSDENFALSAPEANAYESQSQGIIDMLTKLLDKFIEERTTLEKEEKNKRHAYNMVKSDLEGSIKQATSAKDEKTELKADKKQSKAEAEGTLEDTTKTRDDDKKYLQDLTASCEAKASEFESNQQIRGDELVAIEKAIEIIEKGIKGGFVQTQGTSFAQLRADGRSPVQQRIADFLRGKAHNLNSRVLALLATKVEEDPFKKVKKMIGDLITKLLEEANEEAAAKGQCDAELATNAATRKEKTEAVESLTADIDELEASISKLTDMITELTNAVAELDSAIAKATKIREDEKAKNAETISDAKDSQKAVSDALSVLKDFYAKAAESFIQEHQGKPYKGNQGGAEGVVGMLEVIMSDFNRLESDTAAAEEEAQKEYDEFMTDSEVDKKAKTADIEHKTKKKQDKTQALEEMKGDLDGTQKELDAALAYYEKLKPSCVDAGTSYEDRVARRKEEIQSLQEAYKILAGEDLP